MKTLFVSALMATLFFTPKNMLVGRWESPLSEKGNVTGVVFKSDSTFEGYVNKKPFVSGVYRFTSRDSIFSFTDNGCNGQQGIYKIDFFHKGDSLRFKVITDSCVERRNGMQRLTLGRLKTK